MEGGFEGNEAEGKALSEEPSGTPGDNLWSSSKVQKFPDSYLNPKVQKVYGGEKVGQRVALIH
ncbi:hypothetical protein P7K49_003136 [Saguinus oedipus]|uniref:Uncharacterized protein n=1 Tax=Saguinus oedipus TaxID=9490 RepID=A0ABQ9WJU4_SAGOE|nr:hypothetical protein P7K49_003136 [Saguinus oedipus]